MREFKYNSSLCSYINSLINIKQNNQQGYIQQAK